MAQVNPTRHIISVEIENSNHGSTINAAQIEIYQSVEIDQSTPIENMFLKISNISSNAGCKVFGGLCLSSGFAGYYACFTGGVDERQLGCALLSTWSDPLTLNIYIGNKFNVKSDSSLYIMPSISERFETTLNITDLINQHLPIVRENMNSINKVVIGAVAGEFLSEDDACLKCWAELKVEQLGLYLIND